MLLKKQQTSLSLKRPEHILTCPACDIPTREAFTSLKGFCRDFNAVFNYRMDSGLNQVPKRVIQNAIVWPGFGLTDSQGWPALVPIEFLDVLLPLDIMSGTNVFSSCE
jgi:hypothetical protein